MCRWIAVIVFAVLTGCAASEPPPAPPPVAVAPANPPRLLPFAVKKPMARVIRAQASRETLPRAVEPVIEDRFGTQLAEWEQIWESTDVRDFESYLKRYPDGDFAVHAQLAIEQLTQPKTETPTSLPPAGMTRLKALANGRGVREAAPLKIGPGVHRIAILDADGNLHPWHNLVPADWRANVVEMTELALVVESEYVILETVQYSGPSISRYRHVVEAQLYEARTGSLLKQETFWADPRLAGARESYSLTELRGQVPHQEVLAWLQEDIVTPQRGVRVRSPGDGKGFYYDPNANRK